MKKSRITRPFDLLSTSMNYYQAFMPSNHHGISVLCEVYPEQKSDGTVKLDSRGVADLYCVPDAKDPAAGKRWGLDNVIFRLGLPVPGRGLDRTVKQPAITGTAFSTTFPTGGFRMRRSAHGRSSPVGRFSRKPTLFSASHTATIPPCPAKAMTKRSAFTRAGCRAGASIRF